ncbi:HD domain-containing protein [Pseudonocardia acaciae]|uniref:HD domain-containing protein n=1 Tax=Pseudonocardia acaciae TaxID=551276 RepID=UPI000AD447E2|nr:HD domain-containing protein [Pseudonocardia acaciae]
MTNISDLQPVIALPTDELSTATVEWIRGIESTPVANHSIRGYLFARLLAEHEGMRDGEDYDARLTFLASLLHDVGLSERGNGTQRFEVDGADLAAEFLTERGLTAAEVDTVWEAIALHTSPGIAERRGPVAALTYTGIRMDFGWRVEIVTDEVAAAIHAAYPRLAMARTLADEIVAQVRARPEKAERYTLPGELARERAEGGVSLIEAGTAASRWGE